MSLHISNHLEQTRVRVVTAAILPTYLHRLKICQKRSRYAIAIGNNFNMEMKTAPEMAKTL